MKRILIAAAATLALAAPATAQRRAHADPAMQAHHAETERNREIVTNFIRMFYGEGRVREAFMTYVAEGYIQHNPLAPDGRAAAIAALEPYFAGTPGAIREVQRIMVDGDLAVVHVRTRANAEDRGFAIVDILRLEGGKIVEHWDVIQAVPERSANPHPMF